MDGRIICVDVREVLNEGWKVQKTSRHSLIISKKPVRRHSQLATKPSKQYQLPTHKKSKLPRELIARLRDLPLQPKNLGIPNMVMRQITQRLERTKSTIRNGKTKPSNDETKADRLYNTHFQVPFPRMNKSGKPSDPYYPGVWGWPRYGADDGHRVSRWWNFGGGSRAILLLVESNWLVNIINSILLEAKSAATLGSRTVRLGGGKASLGVLIPSLGVRVEAAWRLSPRGRALRLSTGL